MQRVVAYVRRYRGRYAVGALVTIGYSIVFQMVPLAVRDVVAEISAKAPLDAVTHTALWLVGDLGRVRALSYASRQVLFTAAREIEYQLRGELFAHLQRMPQSYFAGQRTGDLMSRAVNDVNNVRLFFGMGLLNVVQTPVLYLGAIGVMLHVDWQLTLWVLSPYPLFIAVARFFGRRMHQATIDAQEQLGALSSTVQENAAGVFVVRSNTMEARERERFDAEAVNLYGRQMRLAVINIGMMTTIQMLPTLAQIGVLAAGSYGVIGGRLERRRPLALLPVHDPAHVPDLHGRLGDQHRAARARGPAAARRDPRRVPSIRDRADVLPLEKIEGGVDVRDLRFAFPGREERPALAGVTFSVEPGQTVGVVGLVGSGKSTLVSAIPRLLEIPDGTVLIDGSDVNRIPLSLLRSSCAVVPQDSFLFSTSIEENIRFGCPDAGRPHVREAARRAHVLEDIEDFPDGFETVVGERGITLSGGQRQRIALARALALDPSILILDDALSSVDAATEEGILKELRGARTGRTCFIVAHRLSAVRDADFILVLDEGRVAEQGTHDELVAHGGIYAKIHHQQQLEAEIEGERGVNPGFHDEELLGKVYDSTLMRRLWPFLRPHWRFVAASIALIPLRVRARDDPGVALRLRAEPPGRRRQLPRPADPEAALGAAGRHLADPVARADVLLRRGARGAGRAGALGVDGGDGPARHARGAPRAVRPRAAPAAALLRPLPRRAPGHAARATTSSRRRRCSLRGWSRCSRTSS